MNEPDPQDNTVFSVTLADGSIVESVYYGSGTLCLSTQAGCAMGCPFCASGANGLRRNLSVDELQQQVEKAAQLGIIPERLTLSGIGEPLQNPKPVQQFIEHSGLPVSLTTTANPLARLGEFLHLPHNGLMLSLHAGSAEVHRQVIPRGPEYEQVWQVLAEQWPRLSGKRKRKIGINYLLLAGVNDSEEELGRFLSRLLSFPEATLHLLVLNKVAGSTFLSPPGSRIDEIHGFFSDKGLNVRRANRWRKQQRGGCGTLVAK